MSNIIHKFFEIYNDVKNENIDLKTYEIKKKEIISVIKKELDNEAFVSKSNTSNEEPSSHSGGKKKRRKNYLILISFFLVAITIIIIIPIIKPKLFDINSAGSLEEVKSSSIVSFGLQK